jgi:hypothetical protein
MTKGNVIVVGFGSIGKRHTLVLCDLGYNVSVVSRREILFNRVYKDLKKAIDIEKPIYIVVANETSKHEETLKYIQSTCYKNNILVEKPLYLNGNGNINFKENIYVAYNLRFHPIIQKLFLELMNETIISVNVYVGQYLPSWRPTANYSESYSADIKKGGGVLRDLSHELDYLHLLFGNWIKMTALGGKFSSLEINSDDHYTLLFETEQVSSMTVHMNYLDFIKQRLIIINTNNKTYKADLINNTLQVNDKVYRFKVSSNETYLKQHKAVLNNDKEFLCSYESGLYVSKMIDKAELSSEGKMWVNND